jgi:hypothetical protein
LWRFWYLWGSKLVPKKRNIIDHDCRCRRQHDLMTSLDARRAARSSSPTPSFWDPNLASGALLECDPPLLGDDLTGPGLSRCACYRAAASPAKLCRGHDRRSETCAGGPRKVWTLPLPWDCPGALALRAPRPLGKKLDDRHSFFIEP